MKGSRRQRGFTLIELILVLVIIAILAGICVPVYFYIANQALVAADTTAIDYLNQVTAVYKTDQNISGDVFEGAASNNARMQVLIDAGYYSGPVTSQRSGVFFDWLTVSQVWQMSAD